MAGGLQQRTNPADTVRTKLQLLGDGWMMDTVFVWISWTVFVYLSVCLLFKILQHVIFHFDINTLKYIMAEPTHTHAQMQTYLSQNQKWCHIYKSSCGTFNFKLLLQKEAAHISTDASSIIMSLWYLLWHIWKKS